MAAIQFNFRICGWDFNWSVSNEPEEIEAEQPTSLSLHTVLSDGDTPAFGFTPTPGYWEEEE